MNCKCDKIKLFCSCEIRNAQLLQYKQISECIGFILEDKTKHSHKKLEAIKNYIDTYNELYYGEKLN